MHGGSWAALDYSPLPGRGPAGTDLPLPPPSSRRRGQPGGRAAGAAAGRRERGGQPATRLAQPGGSQDLGGCCAAVRGVLGLSVGGVWEGGVGGWGLHISAAAAGLTSLPLRVCPPSSPNIRKREIKNNSDRSARGKRRGAHPVPSCRPAGRTGAVRARPLFQTNYVAKVYFRWGGRKRCPQRCRASPTVLRSRLRSAAAATRPANARAIPARSGGWGRRYLGKRVRRREPHGGRTRKALCYSASAASAAPAPLRPARAVGAPGSGIPEADGGQHGGTAAPRQPRSAATTQHRRCCRPSAKTWRDPAGRPGQSGRARRAERGGRTGAPPPRAAAAFIWGRRGAPRSSRSSLAAVQLPSPPRPGTRRPARCAGKETGPFRISSKRPPPI